MNERQREIDRAYRRAKRAAFWADVRQMRWWQHLAVASVLAAGALILYALAYMAFAPRKPLNCNTVQATAVREGWAIASKSFLATTRYLTVKFDNGTIWLAKPGFEGVIIYPARVNVKVCPVGLPTVTGLADKP